jgi:hypothetical protein
VARPDRQIFPSWFRTVVARAQAGLSSRAVRTSILPTITSPTNTGFSNFQSSLIVSARSSAFAPATETRRVSRPKASASHPAQITVIVFMRGSFRDQNWTPRIITFLPAGGRAQWRRRSRWKNRQTDFGNAVKLHPAATRVGVTEIAIRRPGTPLPGADSLKK